MSIDMNMLITICARGGSKGIPGKNIKELGNKPLIAYSIETASKFKIQYHNATDIALSTDTDEIINVATLWGLSTNYKRPDFLAGDTVGKLDAIKDVLFFHEKEKNKRYDYVLDLDVTSPLRSTDDLIQAFNTLQNNKDAVNIFSVSNANKNPYFNMVEQKENGFYNLVKPFDNPFLTRQSTPKVFDLNASFYFYKRNFFDIGYKGAITDKSLIYLISHICFDLDHPIDFEFMDYLIANNKLDFRL
jgi:CMP-N-acetylneuraminic acid synthetase